MKIIEEGGNDDCIACTSYLASLWAIQYVDMLTHYRAYLVLRHKRFPRLDFLWNLMQNDFFPPSILTRIERDKNTRYIFDEIISRVTLGIEKDDVDEYIVAGGQPELYIITLWNEGPSDAFDVQVTDFPYLPYFHLNGTDLTPGDQPMDAASSMFGVDA